jgi:hypothetical protein
MIDKLGLDGLGDASVRKPDTCREAFEKWWDKHFFGKPNIIGWAAWQASRAALLEEIKAGGAAAWIDNPDGSGYPLYRLPEGDCTTG